MRERNPLRGGLGGSGVAILVQPTTDSDTFLVEMKKNLRECVKETPLYFSYDQHFYHVFLQNFELNFYFE